MFEFIYKSFRPNIKQKDDANRALPSELIYVCKFREMGNFDFPDFSPRVWICKFQMDILRILHVNSREIGETSSCGVYLLCFCEFVFSQLPAAIQFVTCSRLISGTFLNSYR